jgi:hypothetical protein
MRCEVVSLIMRRCSGYVSMSCLFVQLCGALMSVLLHGVPPYGSVG